MSRALRGIVLAVAAAGEMISVAHAFQPFVTVLCGEFLVAFEIEVALLEDLLHDDDEAGWLYFGRAPVPLGPGRQHQA